MDSTYCGTGSRAISDHPAILLLICFRVAPLIQRLCFSLSTLLCFVCDDLAEILQHKSPVFLHSIICLAYTEITEKLTPGGFELGKYR